MHSLLTVDLGNSNVPNVLTSDDGLQYILSAPDDRNRQDGGVLNRNPGVTGDYEMIGPPGVLREGISEDLLVYINESYARLAPETGPLGAEIATIYSQYACSLPVKKSTGTMLIAILIADLVFLQAAWMILTWTAEGILSRKDPKASFCEGCTKGDYSAVALQSPMPNPPRAISWRLAGSRTESTQELLQVDK